MPLGQFHATPVHGLGTASDHHSAVFQFHFSLMQRGDTDVEIRFFDITKNVDFICWYWELRWFGTLLTRDTTITSHLSSLSGWRTKSSRSRRAESNQYGVMNSWEMMSCLAKPWRPCEQPFEFHLRWKTNRMSLRKEWEKKVTACFIGLNVKLLMVQY